MYVAFTPTNAVNKNNRFIGIRVNCLFKTYFQSQRKDNKRNKTCTCPG